MRGYCILILLLVTLLIPDTDGWRRRRRRWVRRRWIRRTVRRVGRFYRRNKWWIKPVVGHVFRGREVRAALMDMDANKDGTIDQSEALTFTGEELKARDLLSLADIDGDSLVTVDEFERSVRDLMMMDSDLQAHMAHDEDFIE